MSLNAFAFHKKVQMKDWVNLFGDITNEDDFSISNNNPLDSASDIVDNFLSRKIDKKDFNVKAYDRKRKEKEYTYKSALAEKFISMNSDDFNDFVLNNSVNKSEIDILLDDIELQDNIKQLRQKNIKYMSHYHINIITCLKNTISDDTDTLNESYYVLKKLLIENEDDELKSIITNLLSSKQDLIEVLEGV